MKLLQITTDKDILANNLKAMKTLFEEVVASQDLKSVHSLTKPTLLIKNLQVD